SFTSLSHRQADRSRLARAPPLPPARKLLYALTRQHFADVEVAAGVGPDAVRGDEAARLAALFAAELRENLSVGGEDAHACLELRQVERAVEVLVEVG